MHFAKFKKSEARGCLLYMAFLGQSGKGKITVWKTEKWLQGLGDGAVMHSTGDACGNSEGAEFCGALGDAR